MHLMTCLRMSLRTLNQGSSPMSMDFHPSQRTFLLVGTNVGHVGLWEVGSRERLVLRNFKAALVKDAGVSVNRVIWSSDGALFGKLGHTEVTVANVIWLYQFLRIELDPNRCISFTIQLSVVANN